MRARIALILVPVLACACTTSVHVRKVAPDDTTTPGLRYHLPAMFLKVTTTADGGINVEEVYLPDPDAEYAVESSSVLAKHKLHIQLDANQLLKKVEWNGQAADIAKQFIDSSAEVAKARIDAQQAEQKAADAKAEAAGKEKRDALAAAQKDLRDAETALAVARAKLGYLVDHNAPNAEREAAELVVVEAQTKRDAAAARVAELEAAVAAVDDRADDPGSSRAAPAPVLLRVVDDGKTVRLIPIAFEENALTPPLNLGNFQPRMPTVDTTPIPKKPEIKLHHLGSDVVRPAADGTAVFRLMSSVPLESVEHERIVDRASNAVATDSSGNEIKSRPTLNGSIELTVFIPTGLRPGIYLVEFALAPVKGDRTVKGVPVEVLP